MNTGEYHMIPIDVSDELKDLLKVYSDALKHLDKKETDAFDTLYSYMKRFMEVHEERKKVMNKLNTLDSKIKKVATCPDCAGDEYDEGDDE